jgi:2-polyprenyl-3-methyl-5-hydroxy-6-metoxy-1,4-benzoquinol methylase
MTEIGECPVCGSKKFETFLSVKDHTVSRETFQLCRCSNCNFILTSPRPQNGDLGKYYLSEDYISHTGTAKTLLDKVYLTARKYTLNWKIDLIQKEGVKEKTKKLLDFGCGTGDFLKVASQNGFDITGVEPSDEARKKAEAQNPKAAIYHSLPQAKQYTHITLWHVLEHVPELNETLTSLKNLLSPDGTIFIAVPNHSSWEGNVYKENWAGYDVPRHLWHFSQSTMETLFNKNGLKLNKVKPMKLDAFYISLLSEKYKRDGLQNITGMVTAFVNGLKSNRKAKKTGEYSSLIYIATHES